MRFEIKSGGVAAILTGIAALSGAVFMLGLLAGYDVGRESESSMAQVATAYPVAPPPAAAGDANATAMAAASVSPTPAALPSPAAVAATPEPPVRVSAAKPATVKPAPKYPKPSAAASPAELAAPPERTASAAPPPTEALAGGSASGTSAPATPRPHHKPFNIQIEAAMDRAGATEMAHRLQSLGYQPHLVPAQLNGQTWYKVVIGPYPTQEAAAAAQQEMRSKYNSVYGGRGADPASTGKPGD